MSFKSSQTSLAQAIITDGAPQHIQYPRDCPHHSWSLWRTRKRHGLGAAKKGYTRCCCLLHQNCFISSPGLVMEGYDLHRSAFKVIPSFGLSLGSYVSSLFYQLNPSNLNDLSYLELPKRYRAWPLAKVWKLCMSDSKPIDGHHVSHRPWFRLSTNSAASLWTSPPSTAFIHIDDRKLRIPTHLTFPDFTRNRNSRKSQHSGSAATP